MSVAGHTPGDWGAERTADRIWIGPLNEASTKVVEIVASVDWDDAYRPEAKARRLQDVCLLAAAPELLEVAQALLYADDNSRSLPYHLRAELEVVIAKATGEGA